MKNLETVRFLGSWDKKRYHLPPTMKVKSVRHLDMTFSSESNLALSNIEAIFPNLTELQICASQLVLVEIKKYLEKNPFKGQLTINLVRIGQIEDWVGRHRKEYEAFETKRSQEIEHARMVQSYQDDMYSMPTEWRADYQQQRMRQLEEDDSD